jgi:ADP-heptose:LPS heptosyltransferase
VEVNAPWDNKYVAGQGWLNAIWYIATSRDLRRLRGRFQVGIDVLGTRLGSALMMRLDIPHRLGERDDNPNEHVGQAALRSAALLGATELPEVRPQIYLSDAERADGELRWRQRENGTRRVALGIGGRSPAKCWPEDHWRGLLDLLVKSGWEVALVGDRDDIDVATRLRDGHQHVRDFSGALTLRETFALTAACDMVITNPSMLMHVAAAFGKPTVVVLGNGFESGIAHDRRWGYPGTCVSLGKDRTGTFATPAQVIAAGLQLRGMR